MNLYLARLHALLLASAMFLSEAGAQDQGGNGGAPHAQALMDPAATLQTRYVAAGSPRTILFWNTELTDRTGTKRVDRQMETRRGTRSKTASDDSTNGAASASRLTEDTEKTTEERQLASTSEYLEEPKRPSPMSPRDMSILQRTFSQEMGRAGVHFVDRSLVLRRTAAQRHRSGGDPRLIEMDAVVGSADLLVQVLLVADSSAPLQAGFDVSVKDLARGTEVTSFYTSATPLRRQRVRWVAGDRGFERQVITEPMTIEAVGLALARETMMKLAATLPPQPGSKLR